MHLEIIDDKFGENNYEYEVYVRGEKRDVEFKERKVELDDVGEDDVIEVRAKNTILSGKYGWMLILLYWVLKALKKQEMG